MIYSFYEKLKINEKDIEDEKKQRTKAGNRVEIDENKDIV